MNKHIKRAISERDIATYHNDGVILLEQVFDEDWVRLLDNGLQVNRQNPSVRSRVWDRDADDRTMFYDSQAWQAIPEYQQFIFESPAAELAGQMMKSNTVNFYFDAVFVRSPGSQFETPWHQDEPYWSVEGYDTCTLWMPLTPVKGENALAFVPGSHRLESIYDQYNFGDLNPDGEQGVDRVDFSKIADSVFPNIAQNPEKFGVVSWTMQPGDCVVFNSRIMHGGSGKLADDRDLRVFTTKWLGDDVRINFRECGMDPDHSEIMTKHGLKPGDRPGTQLYPQVWART